MVEKQAEATPSAGLSAMAGRDYDKIRYLDTDGKVKSTRGSGDAVAMALLGMGPDELRKVGLANKIDYNETTTNPGLGRLAFGNALRARVKKGEHVTIGEFVVKKLDQKVSPPSVKAAEKLLADRAKEAAAREKAAAKELAAQEKAAKPARGRKAAA